MYRDNSRRTNDRRYERPIPARSEQMGARGQRRAYEYQQRRAIEANDWSEQREFEHRPDGRASGRPNARSTAWKEKKKNEKKKNNTEKTNDGQNQKEDKPVPDFSAKKETPEAEPSFDIGYYQASVPVREKYCQNFDHGSFLSIVSGVYEEFVGLDNRTSRTMPYSAFLHCMGNVLNAHILDVETSVGGRPLGVAEYASDLFGGDALIPAPVYDYLQCYSKVITSAGDEVKPNLPEICIPSKGTDDAVAGSFGKIRVSDHNKYECYLAPYVTAKRLEASANQTADWQPLPNGYFPDGATPNENLLGYGPIDALTVEGRARIQNIRFPTDQSIASRLQFSSELFRRVQTYLKTKADQFRMKEIPFAVSRSLTRIPPRISNASVEFVEARCPLGEVMREPYVTVHSFQAFGKGQATQTALYTMHRKREAGGYGPCYTVQGQPPNGWQGTRNNNFNMTDPFGPSDGAVDYVSLRSSRFQAFGPAGSRSQMIQQWLKQFHVKKKE